MPKHLIVTLLRNLNMEFNTENLLEIFRIVENHGISNIRTCAQSSMGSRRISSNHCYNQFDYGAVDFPNKTVGKGVSDCSLSSEVNDSNTENRVTDRSRSTSQRTNETKYTTISKSPEINEASANTIKNPSAFYKPN